MTDATVKAVRVHHRDRSGLVIEILSSQNQGGPDFDLVRSSAPHNMLIAAARSRPEESAADRNRAIERLYEQVGTTLPWEPRPISIDGREAVFDVLSYGEMWVAVVRLDQVDVTIDSRGVPLAGVALEALDDAELRH